jgi:hypothetical protein
VDTSHVELELPGDFPTTIYGRRLYIYSWI